MIDRKALRLPAALSLAGFLLFALVTAFFHPGHAPANDHPAAFAEYAASGAWTPVHLGQFVAMAALTTGLVALFFTLDVRSGTAGWLAQLGAIAAAVALGLYGVLQAVDGIALKQAVDAWAGAPEAERMARFATAEAVRWLEWGTRSYHSMFICLALVLLGSAVALMDRLPKALGHLMALSGLAYLAQGWILGSDGFAPSTTLAILASYVLMLSWTVWLLAVAWRRDERPVLGKPLALETRPVLGKRSGR